MVASNIDVMFNDDPLGNQPTTITSAGPVSTQGGTVSTDGSTVAYTPPLNYFGPDSFPYTITDDDIYEHRPKHLGLDPSARK